LLRFQLEPQMPVTDIIVIVIIIAITILTVMASEV